MSKFKAGDLVKDSYGWIAEVIVVLDSSPSFINADNLICFDSNYELVEETPDEETFDLPAMTLDSEVYNIGIHHAEILQRMADDRGIYTEFNFGPVGPIGPEGEHTAIPSYEYTPEQLIAAYQNNTYVPLPIRRERWEAEQQAALEEQVRGAKEVEYDQRCSTSLNPEQFYKAMQMVGYGTGWMGLAQEFDIPIEQAKQLIDTMKKGSKL